MTSNRPFAASSRMLAAAFLAAFAGGCAAPEPPHDGTRVQVQDEVLSGARRFERVYVLQAGDLIEVYMPRFAELGRKVAVRPDGFISLPMLGDVKAAGRSPTQLAEDLRTLYSNRLRDPEVNVIVLNPPEPMVYVVGQVGAPKAVPLRQALTLAQAVVQAGDATHTAAPESISVIRLDDQGQLVAHVVKPNGASQPEYYMAMAAYALKANDLVVVPESYRSQIMRVLTDTSVALTPILNVLILREIARHP